MINDEINQLVEFFNSLSEVEKARARQLIKEYESKSPKSHLEYERFVLSCALKTLRRPMKESMNYAMENNDTDEVNRINELDKAKTRLQGRVFFSRRGIVFMKLNDNEVCLLVDGLERLRESLVLSNNPKQKRMLDVCCGIIKLLFDFNSYSPLLKYNIHR